MNAENSEKGAVMRRALSGVRARVDRLASRLKSSTVGGCAICRKDEEQVRLCWHDPQTEPQSNTCDRCGRTYALRYTVLSWGIPDKS